ncbi:GATA zinc finger domain-containing protein 8-like isoform X2 [Linepithema humile]
MNNHLSKCHLLLVQEHLNESLSDPLNSVTFDEESILKQIENNNNNKELESNSLNYINISNISLVTDESISLNNTYTVEDFPEIEDVEKLENTLVTQAEDELEKKQSIEDIENVKDDNNFDKDYAPSENSITDTDYESNNEIENENISNNLNISTNFNLSSTANATGTSGCDDDQLTVDNSCSGIKKYYCFYCKLPKAKIARHLESVHRNEEDVKKFSELPKGCLERKRIIETIRRKGEFEFNTDKILNDGKLHVVRRPNARFTKKATEYGVCIKCHGFFSKNTLQNHIRKCVKLNHSKNRTITVLGRAILGRINEVASQTLKKVVFPVLREDSITRLIRYDELII